MDHRPWSAAWIVLVATLVLSVALAPAQEVPAQDRESGPPAARWESAIAEFETWDAKNSVPADAVLFVGSSSIRLWKTNEDFPDRPIINRGFGGAHISDVNYFADRIVLPYAPKVIVFYAGDNDIADRKTPQRVFDDYRAFVGLVHDKLPQTRIVFLPIKPSPKRWELWAPMREANSLIREHSQGDARLFYADVATPMLAADGTPRQELFVEDGLHLNGEGYRLWTQVVAPVLGAALAGAGSAGGPPRQHARQATRVIAKTVKINYLLYLPPEYRDDAEKRWPLLLFLHGAGERGDDLEKVKAHGPARYVSEGRDYPFVIVSPQCPADEWWDPDVVLSLLTLITETLRIDPDRVYLTGLSMGGYATWNTAARQPERFAAIVPICGGGRVSEAHRLKDLPIWAFHGGRDPVVDPERSREMVDAVNQAGGSAKLTVYPDAGHDSWTQTYENPELYTWLLSQRRSGSASTDEPEDDDSGRDR